eukprot:scaffold323_cov414-Prasinococcus_capsulatus_cf.AAC.3
MDGGAVQPIAQPNVRRRRTLAATCAGGDRAPLGRKLTAAASVRGLRFLWQRYLALSPLGAGDSVGPDKTCPRVRPKSWCTRQARMRWRRGFHFGGTESVSVCKRANANVPRQLWLPATACYCCGTLHCLDSWAQ